MDPKVTKRSENDSGQIKFGRRDKDTFDRRHMFGGFCPTNKSREGSNCIVFVWGFAMQACALH